jgi:uncharacterized protein (DUF2336 family)
MAIDRTDLLLRYTRPGNTIDVAELAEAVSAMCIDRTSPLTDNEAILAYDILCRIYPDAEQSVRAALARRLGARTDVPRALCLLIAHDDISIGGAVIRSARQLDDDDLIRLVVERGQEHRQAVAERPGLTVRVTDVLVYLADGDIALALARNDTARFSEHGLTRLVNASRTQPSLQGPLLRRTDMPANLAQLMYAWVGQGLRTFIQESFGIDMARTVAADIDAAVDEALGSPLPTRGRGSRNTDDPYPESLGTMLVALRRGDLRTVEREIQVASGLPSHAAQRLLYNGDGKALAVVAHALGAGRSLFSEMFSRLFGTPPYNDFSRSSEFRRAMQYFDDLPKDAADELLRHWRLRPETIWGDASRFNAAWEIRRRMGDRK